MFDDDLPLDEDELFVELPDADRGILLGVPAIDASDVTEGALAFEISLTLGIELPLPPPPAEDADPFCAETQAAHARKTKKQGVVRFSHCIGTPPRMGPRGIGKPSN
jgi:hypothetical protein